MVGTLMTSWRNFVVRLPNGTFHLHGAAGGAPLCRASRMTRNEAEAVARTCITGGEIFRVGGILHAISE